MEIRITARLAINAETAILDPGPRGKNGADPA